MSYLVYCYINKLNGKKYIGITSRSMKERERNHIYEASNKANHCYNAPFKRAIRKYGIEGFDRKILEECESIKDACELEKYYIKKFQTYYKYKNSNGYNATLGGELIIAPKDRVVQIPLNDLDDIKIWDSVAIAERKCCVSIYDAVNNFNRQASSCIWIYENDFDKQSYKNDIMIAQNFICQISKGRKLINIWRSSKIASFALKLSQGNISMCCKGERQTAGSFYWCFYKDYITNNYPIKKSISFGEKQVIQFSYKGKMIKIWASMTEASNSLHIRIGDISESCKDKKGAGGYLWRLYSEYKGENVEFINNNTTQVEKLDDNKNVICSYNKVTDAAADVGIKYTGISRAIKNGCKAAGFYWRKEILL